MNNTMIAYYILDTAIDRPAINVAYKSKIDADIALDKYKNESIFGNRCMVEPIVCDDTGYIYTVSIEWFRDCFSLCLNSATGRLEKIKETDTWRYAFESSETDKKIDFNGKDQISIDYYDERLMEDVVVYIKRYPII